MSVRIALTALALAAALPVAACAGDAPSACPVLEPRLDPALAARLDPLVNAAVDEGFAGQVAVARDGALVYRRAAGHSDARSKISVTPETLFHVASITKYLTALAVLAAAEEGRVELDRPISSVFPDTALAERGVTPMDLLAHRTGLGSSYVAERQRQADGALAAIDAQPIDRERVGGFRYSNDGYDLLAILLERVYGRPYEAVVRETILEPACLDRPRFWAEVDKTDPGVVGQPLSSVGRALRKRNYGMIGSAGFLTTAVDLLRLQHAVSSGALLADASRARLTASYGTISLGDVALGSFLIEHPELGRFLSARGYEDWGDNAILNHYLERGWILSVVTSKGPAESSDREPFRTSLSKAIEGVLADVDSRSE